MYSTKSTSTEDLLGYRFRGVGVCRLWAESIQLYRRLRSSTALSRLRRTTKSNASSRRLLGHYFRNSSAIHQSTHDLLRTCILGLLLRGEDVKGRLRDKNYWSLAALCDSARRGAIAGCCNSKHKQCCPHLLAQKWHLRIEGVTGQMVEALVSQEGVGTKDRWHLASSLLAVQRQ